MGQQVTEEELRLMFWNLKDIHAQMKLEDDFRVKLNREYCANLDKNGGHAAWQEAREAYERTEKK